MSCRSVSPLACPLSLNSDKGSMPTTVSVGSADLSRELSFSSNLRGPGTIRSARNIGREIADLLAELRAAEALIQKHGGLAVRDLDILEVGVGRLPRQLAYFAM